MRRPPLVPLVIVGLGLIMGHLGMQQIRLHMTEEATIEDILKGRFKVGQAIMIADARIAFDSELRVAEFKERDPSGQKNYRYHVIRDANDRTMPMLCWRTTFPRANSLGKYTVAEVRGTLRKPTLVGSDRLVEGLSALGDAEQVSYYLDEMEFDENSLGTIAGVLGGVGLMAYGILLLVKWGLPRRQEDLVTPQRITRRRQGAPPQRRDCIACGSESPVAAKSCANCLAPIQLEYFVAAAIPLEGFERFVPSLCQVLSVSEYQARKPLARIHSPFPYQHLDGFHVRGTTASAPYRIVSRGIPSLVTAQALVTNLKERSVDAIVIGSDEIIGGPKPFRPDSLFYDDDKLVVQQTEGGETEQREVSWGNVALILFTADMPLRGTMTIARDLRHGMPSDASSYLIEIYERDNPVAIRIAEETFHRWEFLKVAGSERPADRFGRLIELLEKNAPVAEVHYVTGVYHGNRESWRLNFLSRMSYVTMTKSAATKQEGPPRLEGYEMLEKLGEGAMGEVYKARQKKLGRMVAVKVVAPQFAGSKKFISRFEAEARAVAALSHPNIVQIVDLTEWAGRYFMVMEFVDGTTVQDLIKKTGRMSERDGLRIALGVAHALEHAWRRGIVHRDIKPENIFVSDKGEVKVGDWGLAKDLEQDLGLTETGTAVGTPYYMSPEQIRAEKGLDIRSDFYALGATLFHCLTGKPPFRGRSAPDVLMKHLRQPVPDPRTMAEMSDATAAVIIRLLAKKADDRCTEPTEIVEALQGALVAAKREPAAVG